MATATHDLNELKRRMQGAIATLKHELGGLRTGRASPSLLEPVQVDAYGSHMPLNQLATVSVPEPRLMSVQVWDKSMVHAVEKAIMAANLGLDPSTEGQVHAPARSPSSTRSGARNWSRSRTNMPKPRGWRCAMCGAMGSTSSRSSKRITRSARTTASVSSEQVQKATDRSSPRSTSCWPPRKRKSSRSERSKRNVEDRAAADCAHRQFRSCRVTSPSSWMATDAGRRRAVCRAARVIVAASRRCAAPCVRPAKSASAFSRSSPSVRRTGRGRPAEIRDLMALLRRFIRNDLADLHTQVVCGCGSSASAKISIPTSAACWTRPKTLTRGNDRLTLVVAFNYGARARRSRAPRSAWPAAVAAGDLAVSAVTADELSQATSMRRTSPIPISSSAPAASSGCRISCCGRRPTANWCSFRPIGRISTAPTLEGAIAEYSRRERRFGGLIARTGS